MAHPRTLLLAAILAAGCAAERPPCAGGLRCAEGTTCGVDGTCRPDDGAATRFARHLERAPVDWGVTRRDHPRASSPDEDTLLLGGAPEATLYLKFGAIPRDARLVGAALTLHVLDVGASSPTPWVFRVEQTATFRGRTLRFRGAPTTHRRLGTVRSTPHAGRPIFFDVGDARVDPPHEGDATLQLAVRVVRGSEAPLQVASPRHWDPRLRPRLELLLQ